MKKFLTTLSIGLAAALTITSAGAQVIVDGQSLRRDQSQSADVTLLDLK